MVASSDSLNMSLQAYLAWEVEQPLPYEYCNGRAVECYQLNERHNWELFHFFVDELQAQDCELNLISLGLKFPLSRLYEDVELEAGESVSE